MNFKLGDLELLFENIECIINSIENEGFINKEIKMFLSNGDVLDYKFAKENLAHLLGINIEYLKSTKCFSATTSYHLLKELISNPYKVNKLVNEGTLSYKGMFSEHIFEKVKILKDNIRIDILDTEFICKYNSSRSYMHSANSEKCDYIIVKKIGNTDSYCALCLVYFFGKYVPMSSLYFENYEEFKNKIKDLITNQEITLLNNILFQDSQRNFRLLMQNKISKLSNLEKYKSEFDCIPEVVDDFKYLIRDSLNHKGERSEDYVLIQYFNECITNGKLVDLNRFQNSNLLTLAKTWNDFLCSNNFNNNSEVSESYSKVIEERDLALRELKELREHIAELKEKNEFLISKNEELTEEVIQHRENRDTIIKLLKPSE